MSFNYSKWDQLELSDDSDIEGHPNVDKKSLISALQHNIHEKREKRKLKIAYLRAQIACNKVLQPRVQEISARLSAPSDFTSSSVYFNSLYEQLAKNPSPDCPPGNNPEEIEQTYDGMLLELLRQVSTQAKSKIKDASVLESEKEEKLAKALVEEMKYYVDHLGETIQKDETELASEEGEQRKHITIRSPKPDPPASLRKNETSKSATTFETLNPEALGSKLPASGVLVEEDDYVPELTPTLAEFSKIPYRGFEKSFEFIQRHHALLVAAFRAESAGKTKLAKQCIHQSLLLQYCEKLGRDGVRVFFQKMISGDKRAEKVFLDDVENKYNHLRGRVEKSKEESLQDRGNEQIQLMITFNVPSGPPPEALVLEGPGTENMDIEDVRKALQFQWDVFRDFSEPLRQALKEGSLKGINAVLADMDVEEAEGIVQSLDTAGILSFAEGGIRDETGNA
ncbi:hsp90-like protein [Rhodocollybia butyracea]|uniref:Hsp90 chaperone protein kinase-targeting subunit n=1 Tax=Rhodocollybia butyracea TaxID=206335 RepID=A0A9P5PLA4_9AGAR|nr:hsp90-like protein [Rhodocollybia butyracea]